MRFPKSIKRALRVHASTCAICRAADGYEEMCQEFLTFSPGRQPGREAGGIFVSLNASSLAFRSR